MTALGLIGPGRHGSRYLQEQNGGRYFTRVLSRKPRLDLPDWVKGTTDPEEFFAPGLDGVVIATPTDTHCEIAMEAMRRGLDVLCEKPLAATWPDCSAMLDFAQACDRRFGIAHTDLFHADMAAMVAPTNWNGPRTIAVAMGSPYADTYEWAPHAVAVAVYIGGFDVPGVKWWENFSSGTWSMERPFYDKTKHVRASARVLGGAKTRRADVLYWDGVRRVFDGTRPSEPTPLSNMLNTFVSGVEDRRLSDNFTRAVYRVLLTES